MIKKGEKRRSEGAKEIDKYTDQHQQFEVFGAFALSDENFTKILLMQEPVSYTHLDVYKRQECLCARARVCVIDLHRSIFTNIQVCKKFNI